MAGLSAEAREFLLQDYGHKAGFLNAHFGRMWTRFNFFISIETGLLGFLLLSSGGRWSDKALYFVLAGVILSLLWWVFGAQDRALVLFYRNSIRTAAGRVTAALPELARDGLNYDSNCHHVGNQNEWQPPGDFNPVEWYSKRISITRLAAYFALVILLLWLGLAWLVPIPSEIVCAGVDCVEAGGVWVPETAAKCRTDADGVTVCRAIPGVVVPWVSTLKWIRAGVVVLLIAADLGLILLALVRSKPGEDRCQEAPGQEGQSA